MHFLVTVIVKQAEDIEEAVEKLLAPYNEEQVVPGKFDWYEIGGRFDGVFGKLNQGNTCKVSNLPKNFLCHAVVTPDGKWHEMKNWVMWPMSAKKKDERAWERELSSIFKQYSNSLAVAIDCHS